MKKLFTLATILMVAFALQAQTLKETFTEEYLKEKVRDPELYSIVKQLYEAHQNNITFSDAQHQQWDAIAKAKNQAWKKGNNGEVIASSVETALPAGAEPFIAQNPNNPDHLVASWMDPGFEYPVYYSLDGGDSWQASSFSSSDELDNWYSGDQIWGGGDPVLAFDHNGTIHMTFIYLHGPSISIKGGMFYVNSTDSGATFSIGSNNDFTIYDGNAFQSDFLDRQWMHADVTSGSNQGDVYMSAVYFGGNLGPGAEVVLKKDADSTGFSLNYAEAIPHVGNLATQFGNIKVDGTGRVHMACMNMDNNGDGDVVYTQSTDGGQTWSTPITIAAATTTLPNQSGHIVHDRDNSATSMAAEGDNVYIAWTDMANNDVRAYYAYSNDGGSSFSNPIEFGPNAFSGNNYHLMPNVAAENGKATISWYVVDQNSLVADFAILELEDAGATMGYSAIISGAATDFSTATQQDFYGDYNSSERNGCFTHSIWGDGRSGSPVVYVAKINTCAATGLIEQQPINYGLRITNIYPNPAKTNLNIQLDLSNGGNTSIALYDANGQLVKQLFNDNVTAGKSVINLPVDGLASGNYLLKVTDSKGVKTSKVIAKQ